MAMTSVRGTAAMRFQLKDRARAVRVRVAAILSRTTSAQYMPAKYQSSRIAMPICAWQLVQPHASNAMQATSAMKLPTFAERIAGQWT